MLDKLTATLRNLIVSTIVSVLTLVIGIVLIPVYSVVATVIITLSALAVLYFGYALIKYIIEHAKREKTVKTTKSWRDWVITLILIGVIVIIVLLLCRGCGKDIAKDLDVLNVGILNVGTENVTNQTVDTQTVQNQDVGIQDVGTSNVTEQDVVNQTVDTQTVENQDVEIQDVSTSNVTEQKVEKQEVKEQHVETQIIETPVIETEPPKPSAPVHTCSVARTNKVDATCTTSGKTEEICSCGKIISSVVIPATGHIWDGGKVTVAATETSTGVKTYTCVKCSETKTENLSKLGHTHKVVDFENEKATCTESGYVREVCSCGKVMSEEYLEATGHKWDKGEITKEPTEDRTGTKTYTCKNCDETKTETIDKLEHTHKVADTEEEEATCTEAGYVRELCSCGKVMSEEELEATGHKWDKGEITKEPTEDRTGVKTYTCKNCDETKTETIDKLEHKCKVSEEIVIEATCTTKGKIKYVCECGEVLDTETTPKLGHDYEVVGEKEPTATKDGYIKYECNNCGDTYEEEIPATGEEETDAPEEPVAVKLVAASYEVANGATIEVASAKTGEVLKFKTHQDKSENYFILITTTGNVKELKLLQGSEQFKLEIIDSKTVKLTTKTPGAGGTVTIMDESGAYIKVRIEFIYD